MCWESRCEPPTGKQWLYVCLGVLYRGVMERAVTTVTHLDGSSFLQHQGSKKKIENFKESDNKRN